MKRYSRRETLSLSSSLAAGVLLAGPVKATSKPKVVIIGGGFGGISAAKTLRKIQPNYDVTLVTENEFFSTCPFSNLVIANERSIESITFNYNSLAAQGVSIKIGKVIEIDPVKKLIVLKDGTKINFDRCIASPGIELKFSAIPGYKEELQDTLPHAWQAGQQTVLLKNQLLSMRQGGTFIMSVPNNPYRCPPGPYERASLVAHYLKKNNPKAKIIIIDGKDTFSKQSLFTEAWEQLYPGMITYVPFAQNGGIKEIDAQNLELITFFEKFKGDVVNLIPPQKAPQVLLQAGLGGGGDGEWCQINELTFESTHAPNIHVLGDAAIVGDMPKSGFSAAVQGGACAHAVAAILNGVPAEESVFLNTCYSLVAPTYGISVAGVYRINADGKLKSVKNTGGTSAVGASNNTRLAEARFANSWYTNLTKFLFD